MKDTPQRWLDLNAFACALLPRPEEHEIVRINCFTARIKYNPARPKEAFNQDRYLEALTAYPLVRVIDIMGTILFKPYQDLGEGLFFDN